MIKQYGFTIDVRKCIDCGGCEVACKEEKDFEANNCGLRTVMINEGVEGREYTVPLMCAHCAKPLCVEVCPSGALAKRIDGIVTVDKDACIGCRYCLVACPFGVPQFSDKDGIMEKCDYCCHRIDEGNEDGPKCASFCSVKGLKWGTMQELSEAAQMRGALRLKNAATDAYK